MGGRSHSRRPGRLCRLTHQPPARLWRHPLAIAFVGMLGMFLSAPSAAQGSIRYHWQDTFSEIEKAKLVTWLTRTYEAKQSLVGVLPFAVHIHFHRVSNAEEPVPWAHTQRSPDQGVHFYVDPQYPFEDFINDWTAPHELSHLILPYLGSRQAWFAEGFASYMQYQIMIEMGVLTQAQSRQRYLERFNRAQQRFDLPHLPFAKAAQELRKQRRFPTLYWGGAIYFWQVNAQLREHSADALIGALAQFVQCCRRSTRTFDQLITQLDTLTASQDFSTALKSFREQPGFPEFIGNKGR